VNLVVGVYYRQSDQGKPIDEAFLLRLQEALCSQAFILLRKLNHPDICWKNSCRQSRKLLKCLEDHRLIE